MQFIQSNFYKLTTLFTIIALVISHSMVYARAQDADKKSSNSTEYTQQISSANLTEQGITPAIPFDPALFPHANCLSTLQYTATPSATYDPNLPFNLSFLPGTMNGFYDVNGDNLLDFIRVTSTTSATGQSGQDASFSRFDSCVYLNNGTGWTKAYACQAITEVSHEGTITRAEYRGDCAG